MKKKCELTILMPCLNEEETIGICIEKAFKFLKKNKIDGEVLIADNGSIDKSKEIALQLGARVVTIEEKGYGSALIGGCKASLGKYVIMGDCDDSYDFLHLEEFVKKLRSGYDLVMGNRFLGGIEKGAMPLSHKYIGNPILSFIGRIFFHSNIHDFHCGLRGYNKEKILKLNLNCSGMEYASEMVVKAELNHYRIVEVATILKKDGRSKKPHLRTLRDGWRHLNFLLIHAPNWLFLLPGIILLIIGIIGIILLSNGKIVINNNLSIGIHSMLYCSGFLIIGFQLCLFSVFAKIYAYNTKLIDKLDKATSKIKDLDTIIIIMVGLLLFLLGIVLSIISLLSWKNVDYGDLNPNTFMPQVIISVVSLIIGVEIIFSGFFINVMNIKHK